MAKEVNKRINVWLNEQGIENNLKSIRAAITKTANELNKLPIGSEEWLQKSKKLSELKSIFEDVRKEIGATSKELESGAKRLRDNWMAVGVLNNSYFCNLKIPTILRTMQKKQHENKARNWWSFKLTILTMPYILN